MMMVVSTIMNRSWGNRVAQSDDLILELQLRRLLLKDLFESLNEKVCFLGLFANNERVKLFEELLVESSSHEIGLECLLESGVEDFRCE